MPIQAIYWRDLTSLELMSRSYINAMEFLDLRQSRWELFQRVREVPMMSRGVIEDTVVVPHHLTLVQLQTRLDYRAPYPQLWTAVAVDHYNWIITRRDLPVSIQRAIDAMERLRDRSRRLTRAGMRHATSQQSMMEGPQIHSVWSTGICRDFLVVWVVHAHMEDKCEPFLAMLDATVNDLQKKVDMRLTTHRRPLRPEEKLVELARYPLVVHWVRLMNSPTYHTRFAIAWHVMDDADVMPTHSRACIVLPGMENVYDICMVDGIEEWTLDVPPSVHRAGAKTARIESREHRAAHAYVGIAEDRERDARVLTGDCLFLAEGRSPNR